MAIEIFNQIKNAYMTVIMPLISGLNGILTKLLGNYADTYDGIDLAEQFLQRHSFGMAQNF